MALFLVVGAAAALAIALFYYFRTGKACRAIFQNRKASKRERGIRIAVAIVLSLMCVWVWSTGAMVMMVLTVCILLSDLVGFVLGKISRKVRESRGGRIIFGCAVPALVLVVCMFAYGAWNMTQIHVTNYTVQSDKLKSEYKVVLITDTHYDTIQDTELLKGKIEEISALKPDIVILGGDIVEEDTSGESMKEAFQVLGGIESKYGIYYVYGNHDRATYSQNKNFTVDELDAAIEAGGITILKDAYVNISDDLVLAGRDDAAWGDTSGRAPIAQILKDADMSRFVLAADHQPIKAEEENAAGVDLVVSGHTHGGQIFPIGIISELTGTLNYGEYFEENTEFIVSSGFTGWGYPIRTEHHCEYVVITLKN